MPPTPKLDLPDNLHDRNTTFCPFRHLLMPGPIAGQLTWKDLPCIQHKCSLWCNQATLCSVKVIAVALDSTRRHTEFIHNALRDLIDEIHLIAANLMPSANP